MTAPPTSRTTPGIKGGSGRIGRSRVRAIGFFMVTRFRVLSQSIADREAAGASAPRDRPASARFMVSAAATLAYPARCRGVRGPPRAGALEVRRMTDRRLTRDTKRAVLGGVAAGLANYFGVDPVLVRLVLIALAFLNGFGLAAYVVGWLIIPRE